MAANLAKAGSLFTLGKMALMENSGKYGECGNLIGSFEKSRGVW
jgi:hypothetical protein